jgi:hypothetical protein
MQSGIAPWPGKTTRSAERDFGRVGRDQTRAPRRDMLDRLGDRAQVAHAVIDDGDGVHKSQSRPDGDKRP